MELQWCETFCLHKGFRGSAMDLGNLSVPVRPTIWMIVGQGPITLAVGVGGVVWNFYCSLSFLSSFILSFGDGQI